MSNTYGMTTNKLRQMATVLETISDDTLNAQTLAATVSLSRRQAARIICDCAGNDAVFASRHAIIIWIARQLRARYYPPL